MKNINVGECTAKEISEKEVYIFLNKNHSQGCCKYLIAYGLYFNNELVQVMTFGKPRFNKNYSWEILRNCTKKDYNVDGGLSKLWECFINSNTVHSCICYSYPDKENFYTDEYINFCGFTNLKKAKVTERIYFEGIWNGGLKRIYKPILERYGVDRLLKSSFGHCKNNEQILLDLGFEKKYEDVISPQVDSYFPEGIVYKITDLDTGKFYIGETFKVERFLNGKYNGTGGEWIKYYEEYKDKHNFKREILKDNFKSPKELFSYEINEIRKYCIKLDNGNYQVDESTGCMNRKTTPQPEMPVCPECLSPLFIHKKTCSKYNKIPCSECGSVSAHRKTCSKFKEFKKCKECGNSVNSHKVTCSKYNPPKPCKECGGRRGAHRKTCSKYKGKHICEECGSTGSSHYTTCSKFKKAIPCEECGGLKGHLVNCSKVKKCFECGKTHGHHLKTCSKYKERIITYRCSECGSKSGHKKNCSKFKHKSVCTECNGKDGHHYRNCSKYKKNKVCDECGHSPHLKSCSKHK